MAQNLVQVSLPMDSGLPEDAVVNTWSIFTADPKDVSIAENAETAIKAVYTAVQGHLSALLSGVITFKWYDRADPLPRAPWHTVSSTITPPAGVGSMPQEVALCLSFHAAPVSGVIPARRRGRVYMGPFSNAEAGFAGGRPGATLMDNLRDAGAALVVASQAAADWTWQVWSTVDAAGREVVGGHVDNAWDTQRRRGVAPNTRDTFGV
jgi:hypothetical protein